MVIVGPEGHDARALRSRSAIMRNACSSTYIFRVRIPSCLVGRCSNRAKCWAVCWPANVRSMRMSSCPCPIRASRPRSDIASEAGIPFRHGLDPQSLRGAHVYRTFAGDSRLRREAEVESGPPFARRQPRGSGRRFHSSRNHQPQDRPHGAWRGRARSAYAYRWSADRFAVLLRRRYAELAELIAANSTRRRNSPLCRSRFGRISLAGRAARSRRRQKSRLLLRLLHRQLPYRVHQHRRVDGGQRPQVLIIGHRRSYSLGTEGLNHWAPKVLIIGHRRS